jgi:hypothetical protein
MQSFVTGTKKRRRGSALIATMMIVAMLMAVVIALSYYQGVARQTYMTEEASLRFREGYRFAQRKAVLLMDPPNDLIITGSPTNSTAANTVSIGEKYAAKIFERDSLPDLRALENTPAHDVLSLKPTTNDVGLRVFGSNTYTTVLTGVPGYAAYAPKGSVKIDNLQGWANPTFKDERKTLEAYSGQPAVVAALKDALVSNVTYGETHAINGTSRIDNGDGVSYKNPQFPLREYGEGMHTQLIAAREQLKNNASSGDKTLSLVSTSVGLESVFDMFFGSGPNNALQQFVSLRNANHFFLPLIPSFSPSPPYLYQFAFSVPYPPDNANYAMSKADEDKLYELGQKITENGKKREEAVKVAEQALAAYNADKSQANLIALNDAKAQVAYWDGILNDLNQQMAALTAPQSAAVQAGMNSGMQGVPKTRAQDPSGNEGITGWNYSKAGSLLWSLIGFIPKMIADGPDVAAKDLANSLGNPDVKLVHFGGKDREFQWILDENNMVLDATLTVPRGRTLKLRSAGTITVAGDIWLQRGSTLYAECNALKVVPGRGSDPSKFFSPSGRIYVEEGSTLVCSGDVECAGSSQWGSVVVGGIPSRIHPITAGIFGRKVRLDSGVYAGSAIDDLVEALGKEDNALKSLNEDLLRPLIANVAPNAAKALGPFWARKPYFAKYATTFQVIFPPTPLFGAPGPPIPPPIPLPSKNVLVPVARVLGYVYSVTQNATLGENFYTHSDWWIFGEGVVPMVPQIDPVKAVAAIGNFGASNLKSLDPETLIKNFLESIVKDIATYAIKEVVKELVKKVAAEAIPYAGLVNMAGDLLLDVTQDLTGLETKKEGAGGSMTAALTDAVADAAKNTLKQLSNNFSLDKADEFLREYNGLLVYADDSITVNGKNATGLFIAQNNIDIGANQCVGTLFSRQGNVTCKSLLFYPYFNRGSFYVPKAQSSDWLERAVQFDYDSSFASDQAVDVGPPAIPAKITAQGWQQ